MFIFCFETIACEICAQSRARRLDAQDGGLPASLGLCSGRGAEPQLNLPAKPARIEGELGRFWHGRPLYKPRATATSLCPGCRSCCTSGAMAGAAMARTPNAACGCGTTDAWGRAAESWLAGDVHWCRRCCCFCCGHCRNHLGAGGGGNKSHHGLLRLPQQRGKAFIGPWHWARDGRGFGYICNRDVRVRGRCNGGGVARCDDTAADRAPGCRTLPSAALHPRGSRAHQHRNTCCQEGNALHT
mmetsp:Transcript_110633/g.277146  ORF Transcript_110633/g.277146 Transcript_110633/m.277146 type:complete len:243 (-) Transcript_110633:370-1098(-)